MENTETKREQQQEEEGPPTGWQAIPPTQPQHSSEMAQMVCGSCRQLLSYPRGTQQVKCSCCETVNFVLKAHQVGLVKCGSCALLLMYPFGAPSVKCSSCLCVKEIGAHNRRPPWSVQQGQPTPPNAVHLTAPMSFESIDH
ncbi:Protein LOL2 [Hibiscus syriacus]|uniref:Protein LOL2 n=1 Tax=Hibiscus syriacus TaxID=106335 RepID=A0A6A3BUU3_HIBSY|nr:protein LOL2-like [Hibiscus syriacus]KAE8720295.1 Protein LOL2 [Hibiscus syriacus]